MSTEHQSREEEESVEAEDLNLETGGTDGEFVDGAETEMLRQYKDSKWGVVDDVDEEAKPLSLEEIICEKQIRRRMTYQDEELFRELPLPKAEQVDIDGLFIDVHADDRNQFVPSEYEDGKVDFPYPETERVDKCTECGGNGALQCSSCSGGGRVRCGRCRGDGTTGDRTCGKCGGTGSRVCGTCDGNGRVVCQQCEGHGETWKVDFVRRNFTAHEDETVDAPGVPDDYVLNAEGIYVTTREQDLADDEIRHEVEDREVPAAKLDYEYDGKEYSLYHLEDELKAESYPMSRARRLMPVAVVSLALIAGGLYYFGFI